MSYREADEIKEAKSDMSSIWDALNDTILSLRKELEEAESDRDTLEVNLSELETEKDTALSKITELEGVIDDLQTEIHDLKSEIASLSH